MLGVHKPAPNARVSIASKTSLQIAFLNHNRVKQNGTLPMKEKYLIHRFLQPNHDRSPDLHDFKDINRF